MKYDVNFLEEAKNQGLDHLVFTQITEYCRKNLFALHTGIRLVRLSPGQAVVEMEVESVHSNLGGFLHGGASATLADVAMGMACWTTGVLAVTVNMNISYMSAGEMGHTITATANVIRGGKSAIFTKTHLENQQGKLIATASGTFLRKGLIPLPVTS